MEVLSPRYWANFKKKNNEGKESFDGGLFEELVRDVLAVHFDGDWEQTSITWDGGKDFVDRSIPGEQAWAECKMYKRALSIKVVSNTLVMAIDHHQKIKQLMFFSYSPLNENAKRHLGRFSESTNIDIQAFDDRKLERLILSSKQILQKFFPSPPAKKKTEIEEDLEIIPFFSTDVHIGYTQVADIDGVTKSRKPFIPINTPCLYEIFLRSNTVKEKQEVVINLFDLLTKNCPLDFLNKGGFELDSNKCLKMELLPGELSSIRILLAPLTTTLKSIPSISVQTPKGTNNLPAIPIEVPRLNRPSLVGEPAYDALEQFETRISGKNTITHAVVSGKSGVGKTRFLEEAEMKLLTHNYLVLRLDGRNALCDEFKDFVVNLLSQIWRLPNINLFTNESESHVSSDTGDTLFDRVCSFVYQSDQEPINFVDELDQILDLVSHGLLNQRAALLIDNVQKLDNPSLLLLFKLSERITGTPGQGALLFAFNEDELIYSAEAALLHDKLRKEAILAQGARQFFELPEFSRDSVEMFLNTICKSLDNQEKFTEHYPRLTDMIYESVLPRPLDLYQLFLAAQDENRKIARVEDGFFFVKDPDEFYQLVKSVNRNTEIILGERLMSLSAKPNLMRLLVSLAYLGEGDTNLLLFVAESSSPELRYLVEGGWLRYSTSNKVDFYHPSIERFIIKILNGEHNDSRFDFVLDKSYTNVISSRLSKGGFIEMFPLASFALSDDKSKLLNSALKRIATLQHTVPTIRKKFHAQALYDYILLPNQVDPNLYIRYVQGICNLAAEGSIRSLVDRLWTCRQRINSFVPATNEAAYALCSIVRQYASYSNLLGQPEVGEQALSNELPKVDGLPESVDIYTRTKIKVNYMNRRCVCLKDMGEALKAEEVGKDTLELALQFDHKEFVCLTLLDLSAIYRNEKQDQAQYEYYLKKALDYFQENKLEINRLEPSIEFSCLENEAHLKGLSGDIKSMVRLSESLIGRTRKSYSHYYLLRGLAAKAVMSCRFELSKSPPDNQAIKTLLDLTKEIEDLAILARFDRFHLKSLHLHAIINSNQGNLDRAQAFYTAALEKLEYKLLSNERRSYIIPSDKALLWDAANFWITNGVGASFPMKRTLIKNTNVSNLLKALDKNEPKTPFTLFATDSFNYPFP